MLYCCCAQPSEPFGATFGAIASSSLSGSRFEEIVVVEKPGAEENKEKARIKAQHDKQNNELSSKFYKEFAKLPALDAKPRDEVIKAVPEQKKAPMVFRLCECRPIMVGNE